MTLPKSWTSKGWVDVCSDVNWEEYGGLWGKHVEGGHWIFVRFENMWELTGEEAKEGGYQQYLATVLDVDLEVVLLDNLQAALEYIGADTDCSDIEKAYACVSYGLYATLGTFSSNTYPERLRVKARREAEALVADEGARKRALGKKANKIGSTQRDMMRGDALAGLRRYVTSGDIGMKPDKSKDLMLRLCGVDAIK